MIRNFRMKLVLGLLLATFSIQTTSAQTTSTILPFKDNTLYENATGVLSNGSGEHFFAGKNNQNLIRRGLVKFDLAEIPGSATIQDATLILHMSKSISAPQEIALHRVSADWGEAGSDAAGGEGGGAAALSGDTTWLHRFFGTDLWNSAGGDFASTASATQTVSDTGFYEWQATAQMIADVQDWVNNPGQNFGWILVGNETTFPTSKRFDSRENPIMKNRPVLNVTFSNPTSVAVNQQVPEGFHLEQNYPNPFNPETVISYMIPNSVSSEQVQLDIFNVLGQKVRTLLQLRQSAGVHSVRWNGKNDDGRFLSAGVYFYKLQAGSLTQVRKMTFLK